MSTTADDWNERQAPALAEFEDMAQASFDALPASVAASLEPASEPASEPDTTGTGHCLWQTPNAPPVRLLSPSAGQHT